MYLEGIVEGDVCIHQGEKAIVCDHISDVIIFSYFSLISFFSALNHTKLRCDWRVISLIYLACFKMIFIIWFCQADIIETV